jgi:GTP-binding protein HflX
MAEIGAADMPSWMILNKRDRLNDAEAQTLQLEFPEARLFSTRNKDDVAALREDILRHFEGDMSDQAVLIPFAAQGAVGELRRQMRVLGESYNEKGVTLTVRATEEQVSRFRAKFNI